MRGLAASDEELTAPNWLFYNALAQRTGHHGAAHTRSIVRRAVWQDSGRCECSLTLEPAHHGSDARRGGIRTADHSGLRTPAPERLHCRVGPAGARRTQMTGWGIVASAVISEVLPTF